MTNSYEIKPSKKIHHTTYKLLMRIQEENIVYDADTDSYYIKRVIDLYDAIMKCKSKNHNFLILKKVVQDNIQIEPIIYCKCEDRVVITLFDVRDTYIS